MSERREAGENGDVLVGYYHITIVAERIGLSPARIRAYERAGLVGPARVQGRARFYGETDLPRLRRLRRLTDDMEALAARLRDAIEQSD